MSNGKIASGLIIDEPWITRILAGKKDWEMRSGKTANFKSIALIKKGSGQIFGTANLVSCIGPLSREEMTRNRDRHTIPETMISNGEVDKWCWAWVLEDVKPLTAPVSYRHPDGAVIWVSLDDEVIKAISNGNNVPDTATRDHIEVKLEPDITASQPTRQAGSLETSPVSTRTAVERQGGQVPMAKDGTHFGPHLKRGGFYQVGAKGREEKFESYEDALDALKRMPTARWRRPNDKGNWGIVIGKEWKDLAQ